jgi:hypothetical protein
MKADWLPAGGVVGAAIVSVPAPPLVTLTLWTRYEPSGV